MTLTRPAPIEKDLYDRFKKKVGQRLGLKEGAVREALEEAILEWVKKPRPNVRRDFQSKHISRK